MMRIAIRTAIAAGAASWFALGALAAPPPADQLFHQQSQFDAEHHPGRTLYLEHCARCHEGQVPNAPHREFLETMTITSLIRALGEGIMREQAAALDDTGRRQIAEYLSRTDLAHYREPPGPVACEHGSAGFDLSRPPATVGWGYDPRRFVPAEVAGMTAADIPRLKLKWAFAFPGALRARSQPLVAMGAVFVGSQDGTVYAFDLATGCARWSTNVGAEVRTAVVLESWPKGTRPEHTPRLFFGDLLGRAYALDALTGDILWRRKVDEHPSATITAAPLLFRDTLFVPVSSLETTSAANPAYPCCSFRGSVLALDPATGAIRWRHYTVEAPATRQGQTTAGTPVLGPSGAGIWNSPTPDPARGLVYHGSGQNYSPPADRNSDAVFALDARSGARIWQQQLTTGDVWTPACVLKSANCTTTTGQWDHDIGASVLLLDAGSGRQILVAGQKSGWVYGLDPAAMGKEVWRTRVGRGSLLGGVHFGMAAEGTRVYVPIVDTALQGDGTSAPDRGSPGVHALDAQTGRLLWSAVATARKCHDKRFCEPGVSAALTALPGVVLAGHLDGMLRAYAGASGRLLWETDTATPVAAVNGATAIGGSISGPGPAVADGHVIVNSGYAYAMHEPGNALLVFSIDDR